MTFSSAPDRNQNQNRALKFVQDLKNAQIANQIILDQDP